jgi:hypothetical protein
MPLAFRSPLRRRARQRVRGWKTPRTRSAEEAFASSPRFGGPKQGASHASVPPGSSCLPCVRRLQTPHHGGFVRGSARSIAPLLNRRSKRLPRGDRCWRATTGVRVQPGRGKSSGALTGAFESVVRASCSPTPELQACGWPVPQGPVTQAYGSPSAWGLSVVGRAPASTSLKKSSGGMWPSTLR